MNQTQTQMSESLKRLEALLDKSPIPEIALRDLKNKINDLRQLIIEKRSPRFALVGRRGSGKSSLINAIFGEEIAVVGHTGSQTGKAKWFTYTGESGSLDILDTRGFQEGSKPYEHDDAATPVESVLKAISEKTPDVLLFLVNAKEADAAIDADIDALCKVSSEVEAITGVRPPIIVIMTHCDLIDPKNVNLHVASEHDPDDVSEKLQKIKDIEGQLNKKLASIVELKPQLIAVIGISAYMSWKAGNIRSDQRWNVEELLTLLIEVLPNQSRLEFARLSQVRKLQIRVASNLSSLFAAVCGGIAAIPFTAIADIFPITTLQISMVTSIAYVSGKTLSIEMVRNFLLGIGANIAGAFVFREAARALIKLTPFGLPVSAAIATTATKAIGKAAVAYYIKDESMDNARAGYQKKGST